MLLLDLKPMKSEVCDCMMASLVNAAIYFNRDYQYLFKGICGFTYLPKSVGGNSAFWKRLFMPNFLNNHEQLGKYHGVKLITCKDVPFADFLTMTETELIAGRPVAVEFDAYCCPWAGVYRQGHLVHYSLVIGIDKEKDEALCVDPYITKEVVRFPLDELEEGYDHFYTFELVEPECGVNQWKEDLRVMLEHNLAKVNAMNAFEMMRCFATEILDSEEFIEEMRKQNNLYSYELFYQMKYMTHSRLNYSELLEYVMEKCEVDGLKPAIQNLRESSAILRLVWLKFTKIAYLQKEEQIKKILLDIHDSFMKVADLEEAAAEYIAAVVD